MIERQTSGRRLRLNHSNAIPRYIVAYDSETRPIQTDQWGKRHSHTFRLGVAMYARMRGTAATDLKTVRFTSPDTFWHFIGSIAGPDHTVWIVSHNAVFDMVVTGITEQFQQSKLVIDWPRSVRQREENSGDDPHEIGTVIIDSPPTIIACRHIASNGRVVIVDTLNWFRCSLAEMGEIAGLPKFAMPAFDEPDSIWFPYCERDAEIVFRTFTELLRWVKNNEMGMFRYTAPAQAMAAYRHRFMNHNILVHDNTDIKRIERKGYFGGRTEVFRLGEINETVYQLDVNSLFPSVMRDGFYPWKLDRYELRADYLELMPDISWDDSVAEVDIKTTEPIFPVRIAGMVAYPIGRFKTVLCGAELRHAKLRGLIRRVRSWSEYKTADLFSYWVNELWGMRQRYKAEGNNLYADFCKKLMNSLYGKFAQLASEWVTDASQLAATPWARWTHLNTVSGERSEYRSFGWTVQRMVPKRTELYDSVDLEGNPLPQGEPQWNELGGTFVAISAFVTSAARMRMNMLRQIAGKENTFYQGVDAVIVTKAGMDRLAACNEIDETELGKLRLLLTVDNGEIYGCSDYVLGGKVVISGRARPEIDKETGEVMQRKFAGPNMLFNSQCVVSVDETLQPWRRVAQYMKGNRQPNGWVDPLELAE